MTRKYIESKLPSGYEIDKCEGVWYFFGPDTSEWYTTCSDFCTLDQGNIEQWIKSFQICQNTKGLYGYGIPR